MNHVPEYTDKNKIRILMLAANPMTGTLRMMLDVMENIDKERYSLSIAFKHDMAVRGGEDLEKVIPGNIEIIRLGGTKLFDFKGLTDLVKTIRQRSFNIIHCWDSLGFFARPAGRLAGCKVIQSYCNTPDKSSTELSLRYLLNWATSFFIDKIIFCTGEVKKSNMAHNFISWKRQNISVIHNCVNSEHVKNKNSESVKNKYSISPGEKILINIGFFNEQKGQVYLLQSLKMILKSIDKVKMLIVGWGPLEPELKRIARDTGIEEHVIFTGKLNRDEVFEVLSISDIFVFSSLWEGFGIVLAEAMACGLPVVTTDTDGSREVVLDCKTGIIVPPKSPEALAQAVTGLLKDPEKMIRMGNAGKNRVEEIFSPKEFIQNHERIYEDLSKKTHQ